LKLFYFTGPQFALENIRKRHLKVSFSTEVNDLFELMPFEFQSRNVRRAWRQAIEEHAKGQGFISFTSSWAVPTMWAHYAQNHTGLCYGFKMSGKSLIKIGYEENLKIFNEAAISEPTANLQEVTYASKTKSSHWTYEDEWRQYISLSRDEIAARANKQRTFQAFGDDLVLKEVIIGHRSEITSEQVRAELQSAESIDIYSARPSFQEFKMVKQQNEKLRK
jgi:hypothetical protein